MSEFHPEWLADLGPWHAVGDTPFLARCLPSDPDGAILILRPWGPRAEQRWRAVFSPPDRDDDGQDWRHGEIKAPDGGNWPDRESAEAALDAAWSAWRERYRTSRGLAPDDPRRRNLPSAVLARIKALGYVPGDASSGAHIWLVGKAEEMRAECDAFATYREAATTALGIEPSSCAEDVAEAVNEMRLTLAAEQGRAEGAPSEGWGAGAGEVRWGKVAGGDEDTYGIGMLVEQVWSAFILRGWRWTCRQLHDRGSTLIVEGISPTARAAMLAADKALETP